MKGRKVPADQPMTIEQVMGKLQKDIEELGAEIRKDREAVHQKELRLANMSGQLQAYASLQPQVDHGSEGQE